MASETRQDAILGLIDAGVASVPTVDAAAVLADGGHQQARRYAGGVLPHCEHCGEAWLGDAETGGCPAALRGREVVALRGQVETLRGRFIRADDRVALLEGLLRKMLSAFSEGEQWWRGHSGCCSETCPDNHRCCALYAEVLAALADGG